MLVTKILVALVIRKKKIIFLSEQPIYLMAAHVYAQYTEIKNESQGGVSGKKSTDRVTDLEFVRAELS